MASCYLLTYLEWPVAVTHKRLYLTVYIAQKGISDLTNTGLDIKMITKEEMCSCHPMLMLEEHETGYVVSPMDKDAYEDRKGADEMDYDSLIEDLSNVIEKLKRDKDIEKIEKAIDVIKKNEDRLKGKKHCIEIMSDIIAVPFENIVEETQMMGLYRADMEKDTIVSNINNLIGVCLG